MMIPWSDIAGHEPIHLPPGTNFNAHRNKRIGDTRAVGDDILLNPPPIHEFTDEDLMTPEAMRAAMARYPINAEYAHLRVERRGDNGVVIARTPSGEWACTVTWCNLPALQLVNEEMHVERINAGARRIATSMMAAIYQRQLLARESALVLPTRASALLPFTGTGRNAMQRARELSKRIEVDAVRRIVSSRERDQVTATLVLKGHRGTRSQLVAEEALLPFASAPREELPMLAGEELARRLPPRGMQAVLASMGLIYRMGRVDLDADGELPTKFRTEVMRIMGMPSRTASKAQRDGVRDALEVLVHGEFRVTPARGGDGTYIPLAVRLEERDGPDGTRLPVSIAMNPLLMGELEAGRCWRIPEALFQVDDRRDGLVALLGLALAFRLAMGTKGGEALVKLLRRFGGLGHVERIAGKQGQRHALDMLGGFLEELRALPWEGGRVDIVGGVRIEGDTLDTATVIYEAPPSWAVQGDDATCPT